MGVSLIGKKKLFKFFFKKKKKKKKIELRIRKTQKPKKMLGKKGGELPPKKVFLKPPPPPPPPGTKFYACTTNKISSKRLFLSWLQLEWERKFSDTNIEIGKTLPALRLNACFSHHHQDFRPDDD